MSIETIVLSIETYKRLKINALRHSKLKTLNSKRLKWQQKKIIIGKMFLPLSA